MKSREKANQVKEVDNDVTIIEVTTGINGYPRTIHCGVIGFDSFDAAKEAADKFGGEVVEFEKRDGWQFWRSNGKANDTYNIYNELQKDYDAVYKYGSSESAIADEFKSLIDGIDDTTIILDMATTAQKAADKLCDITENEAVCVNGYNVEVRNMKPMYYSRDTHNYAIGVEFFGD